MSMLINKKTIAWSLYDFADTAFSALFITFFFPILILVHLGGNELHIGLAMGISAIGAALVVPLIGAVSDATGKRMPILVVSAVTTAVLAILVGYSQLMMALVLASFARITHLIAKDVYDAKMVDIVPRSLFGSLSGMGVAVGYVGTMVSLAVAYPLLSHFGWESIYGVRAIFWEAGIFYVIFILPLFFLVPDKVRTDVIRLRFLDSLRVGFTEVKKTLVSLPQRPVLARFLIASFFYNNGMNTVIIFLSIFATQELGLTVREFFPVFAIMSFFAIIGSFSFGRLADKFGPIPMIKIALLTWIGLVTFLVILTTQTSFIIAGALGGVALGAIWTLNRQVIILISPRHKVAELLGFEGLTSRFSGVLGPIVFGVVATLTNFTYALISILPFFIIGFVVILKIKNAHIKNAHL